MPRKSVQHLPHFCYLLFSRKIGIESGEIIDKRLNFSRGNLKSRVHPRDIRAFHTDLSGHIDIIFSFLL